MAVKLVLLYCVSVCVCVCVCVSVCVCSQGISVTTVQDLDNLKITKRLTG